ncbi:MAG: hypothetical protein LBH44_02000, partial [Treponema sp.]|nr:hypothetical protein [Treponema sp.]
RLPLPTEDTITAFTFNGNAAFGTRDGSLFFLAQNDKIVRMAHNTRQRIIEFAAAETSIAFLTESGELSFLPLDYRTFNRTGGLTLKERTGYTRISPLTVEKDQFLLWQTSNTARAALLDSQEQDAVAFTGTSGRFPLRSVSSRDNKILFMDAAGNISVYDQNDLNKKAIFTFSSAGAIDTAFISHEKIILCRSVISGNSPFLIVNINTGETLPLPHRSRAGIMVYSGGSGEIYGVAVEQDDGLKTTIIGLTDDKTDLTGRLIHDYPGEAIIHSLAESAGTLAIATNQGAAIFGKEIIDFERTEGLPVKILGCPQFFLSLDSEGNIAWHNNKNGKLLAVFSLYREKWILSGNREFSGGLFRP